jgi:signal transduction histidine kinase
VNPSAASVSAWQRWRHSLGARLVLLFGVLALASSVVFVGGVQRAFGAGWRMAVRPLVEDYVTRLAADVGSPPDIARARALTERLPLALRIEGPVVNWVSNPEAPGLSGEPLFRPRPPGASPRTDRLPHRHHRPIDPEHAWLARSTADGHVLQFALDTEGWVRRPRTIGAVTLGLLLSLLGLTWWLVRRWLLRPLQHIGAGAERFGRGDFSQPIDLARPDELGELAGRVNRMATDLHGMLDAQHGLLLSISHELRSPLTRARLNAELIDDSPERDALLRDLGQMRDLISDLLESERLTRPDASLHRTPMTAQDWAALVAQVRAALHAAHPHAEPDLQVQLPATLPTASADRTRLALLVRNVLSNAWRHAADAPAPPVLCVHWSAEAGGWLTLSVRDQGPGVSPEQLARLSEPFYRPDSARTRSAGGVGLGLHLCRRVAEAHGGTLSVDNAAPGLCVTVRLPWPGLQSS